MRKAPYLLRIFAFLSMIFFASNSFAAGYTCPAYMQYTSCASGYYMTSGSSSTACAPSPAVGNACRPCSVYGVGYSCSGGTACPVISSVTCSAGQFLPGTETSCVTCQNGKYCPGGTFSVSSTDQGSYSCPTNYVNGGTGLSAQNQCKWQTTAGTYVATANATSATTCPAGSYCLSTLISYGSTGGASSCPGNYINGGTGATTSAGCKWQTTAGTYVKNAYDDYGTTCTAGNYCPSTLVSFGSTGGLNACPTNYVTGGTGLSTQSQCSWGIPFGTYIATAYATTATTCTAGNYCPSVSVTYGNTNSPTACPTNYDDGGTGVQTISGCKWQTTDGTYVATPNTTTASTCPAGSYCPSTLISYGSTGSITQCTGVTYSGSGASSCTSCPTNYIANTTAGKTAATQCQFQTTAGNYIATANATSQTTCLAGNYCPSTLVSYGSTGGSTACPTNYVNGGSGVQTISGCKWQTTAGNYIATANATTATTCPAGSYCPSSSVAYGSTGLITICPTGYDDGGASATSISDCKIQTTNGTYIATANSTTLTTCTAGNYCAAALINYGTTGSLTACPTNYTSGGTGLYMAAQCQIQTTAGNWIATANSSTQTTCTAGYYCTAGLVYYGDMGIRIACPTNYDDGGTGLSTQAQCQMQTTAGTYVATANATTATTCTAGYACPAALINYGSTGTRTQCTGATYAAANASSCTACPTNYTANTAAGKTANTQCQMQTTAGTYIKTTNDTTATTCTAGYACPSALISYGSTGTINICSAGTFAAAGSSTCTACAIGSYNDTPGLSYCAGCQDGFTTLTTGETTCNEY